MFIPLYYRGLQLKINVYTPLLQGITTESQCLYPFITGDYNFTNFVLSHEDRLKKPSYTRYLELDKRKNT